MNIDTEQNGGLTVLKMSGKLDTVSSPDVQQIVVEAIDTADEGVVIEMSNVSFVSSAGLRVMLIGAKASKAKGKAFRLAGLNDGVGDVFRMTGFDRLIDIYDDTDAAIAGTDPSD